MPSDIDELLARILGISADLRTLPEDDGRRTTMIADRDILRAEARSLANAHRHPLSVENEITMLQDRLDEIDGLFIGKGFAEKRRAKGFSDPGAYSATINRALLEHHEAEIAEIKERIDELKGLQPPADRAGHR